MPTTAMTRPTTVEVVKLLRWATAFIDSRHDSKTSRELTTALHESADALEAASAEQFNAKVERVAAWLRHKDIAQNLVVKESAGAGLGHRIHHAEYATLSADARGIYRNEAREVLRAAGVEG